MKPKNRQIAEIISRYRLDYRDKNGHPLTNKKIADEINAILKPRGEYSSVAVGYWGAGGKTPDDWKLLYIWEHSDPGSWLNLMVGEILLIVNPAMLEQTASV